MAQGISAIAGSPTMCILGGTGLADLAGDQGQLTSPDRLSSLPAWAGG